MISQIKEKEEIAIGIDFGTTNCCVGFCQYERVQIIENNHSNKLTPCYIAFTNCEILIGESAKNQISMNPKNTVFDLKKLIGRAYDDPIVQSDLKNWPFTVVNKGNKPTIEVSLEGVKKYFTSEEISAMLFTKMKESAESFLGQSVKNVVITVPVYFNNSQILSIEEICQKVGLNLMRILYEPSAAVLAYGFLKKEEDQNVLIFHLGGGTFDVSLLSISNGIIETKATAGDLHLGGEDFVNRMVDHMAQEFKKKFKVDLTNSSRSIRRLKTACERVKISLSSSHESSFEIDSLFEGIDYYNSITRSEFENICDDLFKRCIIMVEKVICDGNILKTQVDEIILVGGSTRIPKVQQLLSDFFNGKELNNKINPDEVVTHGGSILASILMNNRK